MQTVKVRKNFMFDKEVVEKAQAVIQQKHKNLTEALNVFFRAVIKEPEILETLERTAHKRTGSFIGMLDGKVGDQSYKEMKKEALRTSER